MFRLARRFGAQADWGHGEGKLMFGRIKSASPVAVVAVGVVALMVIGGGSAVAKSLITGADIKDGSVTGRDIKNGSLHVPDLNKKAVARLRGAKGKDGKNGTNGIQIVTAAGGHFSGTNPSVSFTDHGVTFGPYTDSSAQGGTVEDTTLAGLRLRDLASLTYTAKYVATSDNGGAPYLRIVLDDNGDGWTGAADDHVVIFAPSTQTGACSGSGGGGTSDQCKTTDRMIKYIVNEGTVRYDDDPGGVGPDPTWDAIVNAHGAEKISSVDITAGFALPDTTDSVVNSLSYEVAGKVPHTVSFSK
jgi:hypothetical protein